MTAYGNLLGILWPESILEIVSLLVLVADLGFMRRATMAARMRVAALLGTLGTLLSIVWLLTHSGFATVMGGALVSTSPVVAAQVGILGLTALVLLLGVSARFTRNPGEYVALVLLATTGMMLVAAARDLLIIFVALELLSLSLYILSAFAKHSAASAEAALKYYLFGGMSAAFMLFGFSYLYGITGTTSLPAIAASLALAPLAPITLVALVLVAVGLGFKVAAVPFHLWAPDTYLGAPAPVAALIASGSKVASFAVLIAVTAALAPAWGWTLTLLWMAGASIILGNLAALVQSSVRRILACSAIAHAGYMLLGIAAHTLAGDRAVLTYALTYALTTVGAFGVVAIVERDAGTDRLDAFAGLSVRSPLLAASLLVFLLSLAGIPPLVGFWVKFQMFAAVLRAPLAAGWGLGMVIFAIAGSAVSLYYYLQVLKRAYVAPATEMRTLEVARLELLLLVAIAVAVLVLGIFPGVLTSCLPTL